MKLDLLAFGMAKDVVGGHSVAIDLPGQTTTVANLKQTLTDSYPDISSLGNFFIALNGQYSQPSDVIKIGDEVAIIPPTSGG